MTSLKRWKISESHFVLVIALFNLLIYHLPLYQFVSNHLDMNTVNGVATLFVVAVIIFTFSALAFFLVFLISSRLAWLLLVLIILLNAIALYFMLTYQVVFDKSMIANVLNTRASESYDYFHAKLLLYLCFFGFVPIVLMLKCQIQKTKRLRLVWHALMTLAISLVLIYANAASALWIDKYASQLGRRILPWSYIINLAKYHREAAEPVARKQLPPARVTNQAKTVVVLVIGETARAQNFSLYGYSRETNPKLSQADVIVLNDATACSTYTTASISCMLSHTEKHADDFEPLPSYLNRQGVDVIWHSNNWGEPPLSVATYRDKESLVAHCEAVYCDFDEVLLAGLKQRIESSDKQKIFVVLHSAGSHGPSYHNKYPPAFEAFKPVCQSVALSQCSSQSLINAYDNSILYTDYFLSQVIGMLGTMPNIPSTMLYVSDHGESLGEYGLYLHGTPFAIAPDVQTKVPFLLWMSDSFMNNKRLYVANFKQQATHSQYHVFHSVMGALSMDSTAYNVDLDVFQQ